MTSFKPRWILPALVPLAVTATVATSPAATPHNERVVLTSTTSHGTEHGQRATASGVVRASGTFRGHDTRNARRDLLTLRFPKGTITISAKEQSTKLTPNFSACTLSNIGHGTFTVTRGTGAYSGIVGRGRYTRHTVIVGARSSTGVCLGRTAPPKAIHYKAVLTGNFALAAFTG